MVDPVQALESATLNHFKYSPTAVQRSAIGLLSNFIAGETSQRVFILRGYAGTGKTTLITALAKSLDDLKRPHVLLAPTGRAARVLARHVHKQTLTIHKQIYVFNLSSKGIPAFVLNPAAPQEGTIFLIDKASMIPWGQREEDAEIWQGDGLLPDLFSYAFSARNTKIIFVGDSAQLPPIHENLSAALAPEILDHDYGQTSEIVDMRSVTQHAAESGPLLNATYIRNLIDSGTFEDSLVLPLSTPDIEHVEDKELIENLKSSYDNLGIDEVCVIARTNQEALNYNLRIRRNILGYNRSINEGEKILIVRNNYLWHKQHEDISYLANGEFARVVESGSTENINTFRFQDLVIAVENLSGGVVELQVKVLLNVLLSNTPSLNKYDRRELRDLRWSAYPDLTISDRQAAMRNDPYLNALQIKFGYAITCHQAQGGKWSKVLVNRGDWIGNRIENLRWFYSALTCTNQILAHIDYPSKYIRSDIPPDIQVLIDRQVMGDERLEEIPSLSDGLEGEEPAFISATTKSQDREPIGAKKEKDVLSYLLYGVGGLALFMLAIFVITLFKYFPIGVMFPNIEPSAIASETKGSPIGSRGVALTATPPSLPALVKSEPSATLTPPSSNERFNVCLDVHSLYLRSGPGNEYDVLGTLLKGDCIDLVGRNKDGSWAVSERGWVYTYYFNTQDEILELPVTER